MLGVGACVVLGELEVQPRLELGVVGDRARLALAPLDQHDATASRRRTLRRRRPAAQQRTQAQRTRAERDEPESRTVVRDSSALFFALLEEEW